MTAHAHETPLGGKILTPAMKLLLALAGVWVVLVVVRLFFGLGAVSAQNDGYAWGIWKPLNVVTFTGIAAGAYAVGLVTYLFNRGEYHPLVRSAVMAGAMGYTLAGPSMHQSSLGGLFVIAETKTHPLWHTSWLSGLFLLSCVTTGFGAVVLIENLGAIAWGKKVDQRLLARLTVVPAWLSLGYVALR